MRGDHAAARQVQLVSVVDLHAPDRHGRHPPHPHDVPPAGALRIVVQPLLVLRFLAGQAEDFVRGGEVDHVAGRGLLVTSLDSLGGHRTAITEAQHELTDPFGQPLVGHRKLHRASTGNGPVRIQDPREERTPLGDRGAQILDRDVLVPEQAQRPQLGLEAAVRQPAPAAKPVPGSCPTLGSPHLRQTGLGTGGDENLALPPHTRPQVRAWSFLGMKAFPQTTHVRSATFTSPAGKAMP